MLSKWMNNKDARPAAFPSETETILESITDAFLSVDAEWRISYINSHVERLHNLRREDVLGRVMWHVFPKVIGTAFEACQREVMEKREPRVIEAFYAPLDDWFEVNVDPMRDGGLAIYFRNITARKYMAALADAQKEAMERTLAGDPLPEVLAVLARAIERTSGNRPIAAIMQPDEQGRLRIVAAPGVSADYVAEIEAIEITPQEDCGFTATFNGETVITPDIEADPRWAPFRALAERQGLRAAWTTPIRSAGGRLLGAFSVYYRDKRQPPEADRMLVDNLCRTAAMVMDTSQARAYMREGEARLESQRRLYEAMMSSTPDLVYTFDLQHRFTYANRALLEMWGMEWKDAIGKTCLELGYEPWHAEMHDREIDQVVATRKPVRGEVPFNGARGRGIYDYIFTPIFGANGEVVAVSGITRDVTERKQTEEALRQNESRLRFLTELESAIRGAGEAEKVMEVATRMTSQYLGTSRCFYADVEADGMHFTVRADHVADGSASAAGYYSLASFGPRAMMTLTGGRTLSLRSAESELAADEGSRVFLDMGARAAIMCPLARDGRLQALMAVHQTTPRDWKPEEIRLLESVAARCRVYIERARDEARLREADRRKDEFLAILAHELRNPLAPVRNALYIMRNPKADEGMIAKSRALMERQIEHMVRLVDDLMDISRITTGKIELKRERIDLGDVLRQAMDASTAIVQARGHELVLAALPSVPVDGDPVRLAQVFANLINNAAKYTEPGGRITIAAEVAGGQARISVTDTGIGIAPDMRARIFEMFSQVDSSISRSQGGLGIGLTLAKELVERHGGRIEVASEGIGHGSTFSVVLPVVAGMRATAAAVDGQSAAGPRLKVLIVDDNAASAETIGWAVEMLGHEVRILHDSMAAQSFARAYRPDAVILDIGMPGMDGHELCRRLKAMPECAQALYIAQTGWGQEEHRRQSQAAGFRHHLVKPIDMKELERLLAAGA